MHIFPLSRKLAILLPGVLLMGDTQAIYEVAGGELTLGIQAQAIYDSNIRANAQEESDVQLMLNPSLTFERAAGLVGLNAQLQAFGRTFVDNDDENNLGLDASAELVFPTDDGYPWDASVGVNFSRDTTADPELGTRTEVDNFGARAQFSYDFYTYYRLNTSVAADYKRYASSGFTDADSYSGQIGVAYNYSPTLDFGVNYRYRTQELDAVNPADSQAHAFFFSTNGELLPTLTGQLGVGWQFVDMELPQYEDSSAVFAQAGLEWTARENLVFDLSAVRDFGNSGANERTLSTRFEAGVSTTVAALYETRLFVGYDLVDFEAPGVNREDTMYSIGGSVSRPINEFISGSVAVTYSDRSSDLATAEYARTVVSLGVSATF